MLETPATGTSAGEITYAREQRNQLDREAALRLQPCVWFAVDPQAVTSALFGAVLTLIVLDALLNVAEFSLGYHSLFGLIPLLDLNRERNLPTWFASMQLGLAALLLAYAARTVKARGDRHTTAWSALALGFGFLSLDEFMSLHERLNHVMQRFVGSDGFLGFPWVVVGVPVVIAVALAYIGWLRDLLHRTRRRVLLAGGLYVGGAVGFELLGAAIYRSSFGSGLLYAMTTTVEEGLELIGITLFIAALLDLLRGQPARPAPADHR